MTGLSAGKKRQKVPHLPLLIRKEKNHEARAEALLERKSLKEKIESLQNRLAENAMAQ